MELLPCPFDIVSELDIVQNQIEELEEKINIIKDNIIKTKDSLVGRKQMKLKEALIELKKGKSIKVKFLENHININLKLADWNIVEQEEK